MIGDSRFGSPLERVLIFLLHVARAGFLVVMKGLVAGC